MGGRAEPGNARIAAAFLAALLAACAASAPEQIPDGAARLPTTTALLPDGTPIEAELAVTPEQQARGLMFRSHLPDDRGMLFVGDRAAPRSFWMYRCLIPLDIIWMDGAHRIVEIARDVPPCRDPDPGNCASYGGNVNSVYVLELAAGRADAHGLRIGDRIEF